MENTTDHRIFNVFAESVARYKEKTAVIYLGTRYTYGEVSKMVERMTAGLVKMNISAGDRIMIYLPNSIQWVVSWLAIQRIGGICVPITPIYTPSDISYIANDSESIAIVCADTNFGYVKSILPDTQLKKIIVTRVTDLLPPWKRILGTLFNILPKGKIKTDTNTVRLNTLLRRNRSPQFLSTRPTVNNQETAEILYTGGTTQFPKGVPINQKLFIQSANEQIRTTEVLFPPNENIVLCNAPLFHILGQTCGLATLFVGGTLILLPRVNIDAMLDAIERFKAKTMVGVPTLYRMILEHPRIDQYNLNSVKYWFCAGDVLPIEVGKRWESKLNRPIFQGYGATETCGGVAMCTPNMDHPPKSVGCIVASKKVKIVDPENLSPVPAGETGELIVHSSHMVKSYLNKPEETAKAFIEQDHLVWYRTSDMMSMDAAGNLYFVDRTVDTIKHKGYRVSASEIEAVLQEHPAVMGACVIGIPDESVGERIKAYVVLKEDIKGITGYDLIKWCRQVLVNYKVPQYIEFRDMLPKSKVGKLLRREIRDEEKRRGEG